MKNFFWLAAAVGLPVLAFAGSTETELRNFFNGTKGSIDPLTNFRTTEPPVPLGKPVAAPPDLAAAQRIWGHAAQFALLRFRHPGPKDSFAFVVMGDVEPGRFAWERIFSPKGAFSSLMRIAHAQNPDFIVQLGDFVSKGTVKNYREYLRALESLVRLPYLAVIGNHDRPQPNQDDGDKTLYRTVFGTTDWFYDYNGWRLIGLDSSDRKVTETQLDWLQAALDTPLRPILLTHVPPVYLKGKIKSRGPKEFSPEGVNFSGYFSKGSARFEELVTRRKVARVYMGHIHAFGVADHGGVRYILTGGGGSPLYPLPPGYPKRKMAHLILARTGPEGIRDTVHEADGTVFEIP